MSTAPERVTKVRSLPSAQPQRSNDIPAMLPHPQRMLFPCRILPANVSRPYNLLKPSLRVSTPLDVCAPPSPTRPCTSPAAPALSDPQPFTRACPRNSTPPAPACLQPHRFPRRRIPDAPHAPQSSTVTVPFLPSLHRQHRLCQPSPFWSRGISRFPVSVGGQTTSFGCRWTSVRGQLPLGHAPASSPWLS